MNQNYPELKERLQSTFIDTILLVILFFVTASILDKYENVPVWIRVILFAGIFIIYEPLCMSLGCTAGNYLKGIRVRQYTDTTKRISIVQAIIRYPIKMLLGWISFLTIHSNPQRRAIHDLASGSVMIKTGQTLV